ncbi:MAG: N-acetylmuramoyl-L-alanine amidase family protein [Clostridium sp.]
MTRRKKSIFSLLLIICAVTMAIPGEAMTAYAASRKTISKVTISLNLDMTAGDILPDLTPGERNSGCNVEGSSDWYVADEARWVSSADRDVKIGNTYTMKVTLTAKDPDQYAFQGTYKASNVTVKGGTFVSASRKGYDALIVTIKTKPVKGEFEAPSDAYWKENQLGIAEWEKADNAEAYEISLYKGNNSIYKVQAFKGTKLNFYPYMTSVGTYRFKVRSVAANTDQKEYAKSSEWMESDELYIAKEAVSDGSGKVDYNNNYNNNSNNNGNPNDGSGTVNSTTQVGWIQNGGRWFYRYPDGNYPKNDWLKVNNIWYLFDSEGWMMTGWQEKNGYWYYLDNSGAMRTGWIQASNGWYFLNMAGDAGAGAMYRNQWLDWKGKKYYLGVNGVMCEGWNEIGGNWHYFYPGEGSMAVNTAINTFFVGADGVWHK